MSLQHCTSITGGGLEPLRWHAHIENIDLNIVPSNGKKDDKKIQEEAITLSVDVVTPILESILDEKKKNKDSSVDNKRQESTFHFNLPEHWCDEQTKASSLVQFIEKYQEKEEEYYNMDPRLHKQSSMVIEIIAAIF